MDDFEAPTLQDEIGRLGRYSLLTELAEGGMARVFLARKDASSDLCVLKQLHVELEKHPTAAKRFQREAHLIAHLNHGGIARIVDAGVEGNKFCIAMEYIPGQTLESLLDALEDQEKLLPPAMSCSIISEVLDALYYAHTLSGPEGEDLRIVHRDLSPGNVMISYAGEVKVIDFGVAQGRIDNFRTAPGMMVGTLRYMSPEQALAEDIDHRSDLYTVAVVLYEMLCGEPVVARGKAVDVLTSVIERAPVPLRERNPDISAELEKVVHRALQKKPEDRFQNAKEFRQALEAARLPLGRTTQKQLGTLVSQLFAEEEISAQRWQDLAPAYKQFGARDTEDWRNFAEAVGASSSVQAWSPSPPPLRSSSLASGAVGTEPMDEGTETAVGVPQQGVSKISRAIPVSLADETIGEAGPPSAAISRGVVPRDGSLTASIDGPLESSETRVNSSSPGSEPPLVQVVQSNLHKHPLADPDADTADPRDEDPVSQRLDASSHWPSSPEELLKTSPKVATHSVEATNPLASGNPRSELRENMNLVPPPYVDWLDREVKQLKTAVRRLQFALVFLAVFGFAALTALLIVINSARSGN